MTDAPVPDPGPRELPGLDAWWDGTQWRHIGAPIEDPSPHHRGATPWDETPAQNRAYAVPTHRPAYGIPLASPDVYPPPVLAYAPWPPPGTPRRSRANGSLWAVAIAGAVFLVSSLVNTMAHGSLASSNKPFVEIPVVAPAGAVGALPLDRAEEFAATFEVRRDAEGSYVGSAQEITRAFGAEIVWAEFGAPDPTTKCATDDASPESVLAWYCGAEPYLIRLNRIASNMPGVLYTPVFVDAVKHELAHLAIRERCGESQPSEGTVELEGVTNSYAVLYLGADGDALGDLSSTFPEYALSSRTDEVAMWIHAGVCWYESSSVVQ